MGLPKTLKENDFLYDIIQDIIEIPEPDMILSCGDYSPVYLRNRIYALIRSKNKEAGEIICRISINIRNDPAKRCPELIIKHKPIRFQEKLQHRVGK